MIQSSSTAGDEVQDEEKSEIVQLGEFRELNTATVGYVEDLTAELQIGKKV